MSKTILSYNTVENSDQDIQNTEYQMISNMPIIMLQQQCRIIVKSPTM